MSLIGVILTIYIWTLLVLVSEQIDGLKGKSLKEKVLYITLLFGIVIAGIILF